MAGELADLSSDRHGATVLWVTVHTAEGPEDDFPADPALDSGSARDLLAFGLRMGDRSWHACCDDDVLLDDLVPYDRAAWTLRGGNPRSDNLEMCGLASWSREEWLEHPGMLRNAARWVARRLRARGMTPRRLTVAEVAARSARGYIDHNTYTVATGDGTHWDVGPRFPWDVFGDLVTRAYNGQPLDTLEDDDMFTDTDRANLTAARGAAELAYNKANHADAGVAALAVAVAGLRTGKGYNVIRAADSPVVWAVVGDELLHVPSQAALAAFGGAAAVEVVSPDDPRLRLPQLVADPDPVPAPVQA